MTHRGPVHFALLALVACRGSNPPAASQPTPAPTDDSAGADSGDDTGDDTGDDSGEPATPALFALSATPRNLLVISIDTLRVSDVGYHGGGDDTPFLDGLMAEGVVLEKHRSCSSWTYPGAICAMTGTSPAELGYFPLIPDAGSEAPPLPDGAPTLAATLAAAGFQTRLLTSNGYLGGRTDLARGFDILDTSEGLAAEAMTTGALGHADRMDTTTPWMLQVHYIDPHAAYNPPADYLTALADLPAISWDLSDDAETKLALASYPTLSDADKATLLDHVEIRYEGEVRYLDDQLAVLWSELGARGLLDDTLVMFWSDHGEQFFEHDSFGHAGTLFSEENDALGFFWSPLLAAETWTAPTTHEDLPPTALALLGLPADAAMTGIVAGTAEEGRGIFSAVIPRGSAPVQSVTVGDSKLIYSWSGNKMLFHRDTDALETTDLYDMDATEVQQLWELLLPRVVELDQVTEGYTPVGPGA